MKNRHLVLVALSSILLSCGPSKTDYTACMDKVDSLQTEFDRLKQSYDEIQFELDSLKYGASRLLQKAQKSYRDKEYDDAIETAKTLMSKHPDSKEAETVIDIKKSAEKEKLRIEKTRKEVEAKRIAEEKQRLAQATKKMKKETDEIEGITWYKDKSITSEIRTGKHLYLYIGKKATKTWLRLRIQYAGVSWLFIKRYTIKTDNEKFTLTPNYGDVNKESYDMVWEWWDKSVTASDIRLVKAIIESKKAIVRFEGDTYARDWEVPRSTKQALRNVLDAFVALGGSLSDP